MRTLFFHVHELFMRCSEDDFKKVPPPPPHGLVRIDATEPGCALSLNRISSVASFFGIGGGARGPKCTDKIIYIYCASDRSERAPQNIYVQDSKHTSAYIIQSMQFSLNYLWYGTINDIILTKH